MPGQNLTRIEAEERAKIVHAHSYDVVLDLTRGEQIFSSVTTVKFSASAGASTFIDLVAPKVNSAVLNGVALNPDDVFADSRIRLDNLAAENVLVVDADAAYTNTGEGLHRFVDPVDNEVYLYSQFEVPDSRRMFTVFEQPNLKATFTFTVTAPDYWQVVSNQPTPEPVASGAGKATWSFTPTPVISSYITALIAGPYHSTSSTLTSSDGREIPLRVFTRGSLFEFMDADYIFDKTREGFTFFEEIFDYPYPFEKYDQLFVPEFNAGAMENAGAVTFTETYVFRSKVTDAIKERRVVTILHELAHMWFGDLVTMNWWNDLWLNESFAEYMSTLAVAEATEWHEAWTTFNAMEKSWAYRQDQLPSTHPIVAEIRDLDDVQVNFDGITYAKGGSVLKQLVAWVGRDNFFQGVAQYFRKHEWKNTELVDLLRELEATSGRELGSWSKLWLETAGVNTLKPVFRVENGTFQSFAVVQSAHPDYPTIRPHRMAIGLYNVVDGRLERAESIELDVDGVRTEVPEMVGKTQPDLVLLNDEDLAYAKIRLDERSLASAIEHLGSIANPLARSLVWGSVWDSTRDGETPSHSYIDLVLKNIATENESTTLRTTLSQLLLAARMYVTPESREATVNRVGDALWQLAQDAEAGSDNQFQFVKFFAQIANTESHYDALESLRTGAVTLKGLEIDTDLAWELLEGLTLGGRVSEAQIAEALAADNTSNGQQAAARALATIPSAEAKLAAFSRVVDNDTEANVIVRSVAMGVQHVNDPATLEAIVERYFDSLNEIWASRSYQIAAYLVTGLYPAGLANQQLVDKTNAWLKSNTDIPALSRLVLENLAGIERALMAQEKDRA
ncbi:MAG: aminopeptidase N [Microbacteriaceae bacterium]